MKILKIVVEVVEGQKLTLTGEQLEAQPGLKRDIIEKLSRMDGEKCVVPKVISGASDAHN
jgi:hypothetical protein